MVREPDTRRGKIVSILRKWRYEFVHLIDELDVAMELHHAAAIADAAVRRASSLEAENARLRELAEKVKDCCSFGYAGVACDDHIALRAALATPQDGGQP